ncbi:complement C1q-like protein 2 [Mercenaria mercenaria]|uniref:complement C1q-like protein 2 n=1 Tax=Mercenaria mercenaria TaxID=6596 RepID=UPI00234F3C5E|nr:complement C1q-like protein 2 [Mercenaria mercenaria]
MLRVVLSFLFIYVAFSEPECSRFHYEEQTLNKMIRVEIAMEKLQLDMAATQQQVLDALRGLREETQQIKDDWNNEKESLKRDVKDMKGAIANDILEFTNELEKLKGPAVAFRSKDVADLTPNSGDTLVFQTTMLNEGLGYDNTTGIFTAPVGGTYIFTVQFCVVGGKNMYYVIVADNEEIKKGWFCDAKWTACYSADAVVVLKQGARVQVKCSSSSSLLSSNSNYWNTFSGVFVHA